MIQRDVGGPGQQGPDPVDECPHHVVVGVQSVVAGAGERAEAHVEVVALDVHHVRDVVGEAVFPRRVRDDIDVLIEGGVITVVSVRPLTLGLPPATEGVSVPFADFGHLRQLFLLELSLVGHQHVVGHPGALAVLGVPDVGAGPSERRTRRRMSGPSPDRQGDGLAENGAATSLSVVPENVSGLVTDLVVVLGFLRVDVEVGSLCPHPEA